MTKKGILKQPHVWAILTRTGGVIRLYHALTWVWIWAWISLDKMDAGHYRTACKLRYLWGQIRLFSQVDKSFQLKSTYPVHSCLNRALPSYQDWTCVIIFLSQLTGLPTTSGAIGNKEAAPKQAVADADADLQARSGSVMSFIKYFSHLLTC